MYKLSSLFAFRRRPCNLSAPRGAGCLAGEGTPGTKTGAESSMRPPPSFVLTTSPAWTHPHQLITVPVYTRSLPWQPSPLTFHTHTHACKCTNPFVSYCLNHTHAQMYMYIDIYLSVYNWRRRAEEVQWWKQGVGQESGLPDRFAVKRQVQGQVSKARSGLGTGAWSIA